MTQSDNGQARSAVHIVEFSIEDVMKIKAVRVRPVMGVTRIEGANDQGKSAIIKALARVLCGAAGVDMPEPVRRGSKKAVVQVRFSNGIRLEWSETAGGTTDMKLVGEDGTQYRRPREIIDRLYGDLTFDALKFLRMKPADQHEELRRLARLDFTEMDDERQRVFDERTGLNRDLRSAQARLAGLDDVPPGIPDEEVSAADLADELAKATAHNQAMQTLQESIAKRRAECQSLLQQMEALKVRYDEQKRLGVEEANQLAASRPFDLAAMQANIRQVENTNALVRRRRAREDARAEVKTLEAKADDLTRRLDEIDRNKREALAAAKFPVPGLTLGPGCVLLNGYPIQQANAASQLRASVAIGLAQNKPGRLALIEHGEMLDEAGMQALEAVVKEHGAQAIVERVTDHPSDQAVVIVDGEVESAPVGVAE